MLACRLGAEVRAEAGSTGSRDKARGWAGIGDGSGRWQSVERGAEGAERGWESPEGGEIGARRGARAQGVVRGRRGWGNAAREGAKGARNWEGRREARGSAQAGWAMAQGDRAWVRVLLGMWAAEGDGRAYGRTHPSALHPLALRP